MEEIKTFIALEIPDFAKRQCIHAINHLQGAIKQGVSWEKPAKLHLTLRFLRDIRPKTIPLLKLMLDSVLKSFHSFNLEIGTLGVFPSWKAPRVIWLGLDQPSSVLMHLQQEIETQVQIVGYKTELRKFSPHVTIGHVQRHLTPETLESLGKRIKEQPVIPLETVNIQRIILFESKLLRTGSVYSPLHAVKLINIFNRKGL